MSVLIWKIIVVIDDDLNDYADNGDPGGACTYNTTTGIPDENCYFVPNPDADVSRSSNITSSSYDIYIIRIYKNFTITTSALIWRCPSSTL